MALVGGLQPGDPQWAGPYRLLGRLGSGGMAQVFLGRSAGGRPVAVKIIRAELAGDPDFRSRFGREVAAARRVSGLFTALVVDADVDGPMPWLATAYVAGPSLAAAVTGHGPLPAGTVLALAAGLLEGLGAIHAQGLVHRDLKPSNVLLASDGPRVIDFGISRAAEASALTHTGVVIGSPGFMSPEQAEGREVGPPSDVFSLGAVLVFAATGEGPFGTGATASLIYRVVHGPPSLDRVPAEVRQLVEQCLAKDPGERPAVGELLAQLGAANLTADWLPERIIQDFPRYVAPYLAPAGAADTEGSPAWAVTQSPASPGAPGYAFGGLPTVGAGNLSQPPKLLSQHRRQQRLMWAWVTGGILAASAAIAFALGGGGKPPLAQSNRTVPAALTSSPAVSTAPAPASVSPDTSPSTILVRPTAQPGSGPYGSIAWSPSNLDFGVGFGPDKSTAEANAVQNCQDNGGGTACYAAEWYYHAVGAIAQSSDATGVGFGYSNDLATATTIAKDDALKYCREYTVNGSSCSLRGVLYPTSDVSASGTGAALLRPAVNPG